MFYSASSRTILILFFFSQDAGSQQIGFLLGSCGVSYALTSEACFKGLPKTATGDIHVFRGQLKNLSFKHVEGIIVFLFGSVYLFSLTSLSQYLNKISLRFSQHFAKSQPSFILVFRASVLAELLLITSRNNMVWL